MSQIHNDGEELFCYARLVSRGLSCDMLEHHLYPGVPSHHLAELGRRLEPFFAANGVKLRRVP